MYRPDHPGAERSLDGAGAVHAPAPERAARKPYARPRLTRYGDVRGLTLGPSPGVGESGNPGVFKV